VTIGLKALNLCYKNQSVHFVYGKIAVFSEIHTKHIKTLCGQYVEFFNVKPLVNDKRYHLDAKIMIYYYRYSNQST